jgi:predicted nuclease of restriction endonuclease-like (RecB) superfamily
MRKREIKKARTATPADYANVLGGMVELLEVARHTSARTVNALMTATYWEIGHRIVEYEQGGAKRADYGEELVTRLATDLSRFGRGFGKSSLFQMRAFFLAYSRIFQTLSGKSPSASTLATRSGLDTLKAVGSGFPLPWSHYVVLLRLKSNETRAFYETEALRGGWSVRQLQRQIDSQFYERTALSRDKAKMLTRGARARPDDALTADEEVKDPLVLEFLGLKDEYSESELEEALIRHLEHFLLELGNDFTFVARQRRLRIDDEWYRVDLLSSRPTLEQHC